jgi:hypothetical protein
MERVDLELSDFTRRAGSVLVAHSDAGFDRGLEPGEKVVVRDGGRQHYLATVRDISFDLTDTHYRLELGDAVRTDEADLLLAATWADPAEPGSVGLADVIGLLRQARSLAAERSYLANALPR